MPRLWITKDNPETSKPKSETKRIYTPEVRIIRPEIISNIPPGLYSCTCLDYNDVSYLNALAASGALSLGTTAGTDRSISGEFGGTTPHGLSEYYGVASGVPASGAIDFSDFHGTSAGPPITDCLWTHYDFSECSTGTIDKWGTTGHSTECQCMRAYYWRCCPGPIGCLVSVASADANGSCICKSSSCWNGNAFLGFTPISVAGLGATRPMAATQTGRANWLSACYGTSSSMIDANCAANTRFMVFGGQHAISNYFTPWSHTGMLGMYPVQGNSQFYLGDITATGRCGSLAGCGAHITSVWSYRGLFESLINDCNIATGTSAWGHNYGNYPAMPQWSVGSSSDCAILSRPSTNGPVIVSMRVNPTSTNYVDTWPGYSRFTIGWIQKDCTPIIDATRYGDTDSLTDRAYWGQVRTNIPCGGFDFWNPPASFSSGSGHWAVDVVDCFQTGEFLVYNCSLTDTEYCSVLNYLHEKWQGDM